MRIQSKLKMFGSGFVNIAEVADGYPRQVPLPARPDPPLAAT